MTHDQTSKITKIGFKLTHVFSLLQREPDTPLDAEEITSEEFHKNGIFQCWQATVVPIVESLVKFTKRIPNFQRVDIHDRITLLKKNGFSVITALVSGILVCFSGPLGS